MMRNVLVGWWGDEVRKEEELKLQIDSLTNFLLHYIST